MLKPTKTKLILSLLISTAAWNQSARAAGETLSGDIFINAHIPPALEFEVISQNNELNISSLRGQTVTDRVIGQLHIRSNVDIDSLEVIGSTTSGMPENEASNYPVSMSGFSLSFGGNDACAQNTGAGSVPLVLRGAEAAELDVGATPVDLFSDPAVVSSGGYAVTTNGAIDAWCDIKLSFTTDQKMPEAGYYQQQLTFTLTAI